MSLYAAPTFAQDDVTFTFRLTVRGTPCENATFWGFYGLAQSDDINFVQLTDPDGDGVYTGSGSRPASARVVLQIVQGTGVEQANVPFPDSPLMDIPGDPQTTIRVFGTDTGSGVPEVTLSNDLTLEASVNGCATLPPTGTSDHLQGIAITSAVALLVSGAYLRRRVHQQA